MKLLYRLLVGLIMLSWLILAPHLFFVVMADATLSAKSLVFIWFIFAMVCQARELSRGAP